MSTATTLTLIRDDGIERDIPTLPNDGNGAWHPLTVEWWDDIHSSPMSDEWEQSDIHGLYVLAALVDRFWHDPSPKLAAEIRLQRQCFGLTPIDRRRLQWEIERGEGAATATQERKRKQARDRMGTPVEGTDPRRALA